MFKFKTFLFIFVLLGEKARIHRKALCLHLRDEKFVSRFPRIVLQKSSHRFPRLYLLCTNAPKPKGN